ncbi:ABC transporter ATP-binding protein [Streptomyces phaeofaciens]|uniref:ABC transporter ATP-binding protein n=1 Tax=Streptomyces phaeofaciens TaxID=68254 RepID=UPI0036C63DBE
MAPAIEARGLTRRFGGFTAVHDLNLEVAEGEIFGFLGSNGAGKSTSVAMLVGLLRPTGGSVRILGRDVHRESREVRRNIGVALQEAALDPLMTCRELLRLQAALYGLDRATARDRTRELTERLMLGNFYDRRVGTFSGGMRRRLDLALAVLHAPRVLFLDEPTTGLDVHSRRSMWQEVKRLREQNGTTVFLTTQYLEEADQLADRVAIMDRGRLLALDTPQQLKRTYGTTLVRVGVRAEDHERALAALRELGPATSADETIEVRPTDSGDHLARAVALLHARGVTITGLTVQEASIDDAFIGVTSERPTPTPTSAQSGVSA